MKLSLAVHRMTAADAVAWDHYVSHHPEAHFGQALAWKRVVEASYGCRAHYWIARRGDEVVGVLPLFEKRRLGNRILFSAPGGLLAEDDEVAQALLQPARDALEANGLDFVELRDQRRAWPGLETNDEHVTMVLDLPDDQDVLWKGFNWKLRNRIRKGLKASFDVHWARHADSFHKVLLENMRDLGTPIMGRAFYDLVTTEYGSAAEQLVISLRGRAVGAMLTIEHGGVVADPWASSLRSMFRYCPNQVLYWEALCRAIARGAGRFDMGRSQRESGTYGFKEQWGAQPVQLYYQYILGRSRVIPTLEQQRQQFDMAVRVWKRLPVAVAELVGPHLKRLFPEAI